MIPYILTALGGFLIGSSIKQYGRGGKLPANVKKFIELQDEVNRQIDEKGEADHELADELNRIGDSLNSYESELAIEEYMKRREPVRMANGGSVADELKKVSSFVQSYYETRFQSDVAASNDENAKSIRLLDKADSYRDEAIRLLKSYNKTNNTNFEFSDFNRDGTLREGISSGLKVPEEYTNPKAEEGRYKYIVEAKYPYIKETFITNSSSADKERDPSYKAAMEVLRNAQKNEEFVEGAIHFSFYIKGFGTSYSTVYSTDKKMANGGEVDKMQLNVGYNYAVDRNVDASGTFEQFKEDFKKKVPKSAKFSEQVMKAIYYSLQQDWGKMANGGVLKKVRKYHADGLLEITRSGILGNDFKSTDGRFKAKQSEKSFIKDGIKRSRYEVTIDGQPVEGYHALEDAYLLAINYLDNKMASGGNIEAINFSLKQYAKGGVVKNLSSSGAARWAELENLLKDKINEKGGGQIKAKIITKKGNDTVERFALASGGMSVLRMMKGKKRFGQLLTYVISDINDVEGVQFYDESESSYADDLEKKQKYILKNIHPNLWSDLKNEYSFSSDKLERFRNAAQGLSHYESYKLAGQYDLPKIEQHKTITMQSAGMPEYAQRELAKAIEEKRDYRYSWDCGYDCSVSTKMGDDGIYRGWFSQEFRGTGNGYYWLLISPTQAIFVERD